MWVRKNCILNVEFVQQLKLGRCEVELCTCRTRDLRNSEPGFGMLNVGQWGGENVAQCEMSSEM